MPVKYQCPKCNRRFAEWGAEKLGFTCPNDDHCPEDAGDEQIELVRMGVNDDRLAPKKPSPKKRLVRRPLTALEEGDTADAGDDGADDIIDESGDGPTDDELEIEGGEEAKSSKEKK